LVTKYHEENNKPNVRKNYCFCIVFVADVSPVEKKKRVGEGTRCGECSRSQKEITIHCKDEFFEFSKKKITLSSA